MALLLGNPNPVIMDGRLISLYASAAILVHSTTVYRLMERNYNILGPIFDVVQAMKKGSTLVKTLLVIRTLEVDGHMGSDSFLSQIILGIWGITGGGYTYSWLFCGHSVTVGGYNFWLMTAITVGCVGILELGEATESSVLYPVIGGLKELGVPMIDIETSHLKALCSIIILMGVWLQPKPEIPSDTANAPKRRTNKAENSNPNNPFVVSEVDEDDTAGSETKESIADTPRRSTRSKKSTQVPDQRFPEKITPKASPYRRSNRRKP